MFGGTYFLTANGNISQVGDGGDAEPLAADKVSLASSAAILMTGLVLRSDNEDGPNLQIKAGTATPLDVINRTVGADRSLPTGLDVSLIPTSRETSLSPVVVQADRSDGSRPDSAVEPRDVRLPIDGMTPDLSFTGEFEDLLVGEEPSRLAERAPEGGFDPALDPVPPNTPIDIRDAYSAVIVVRGDVTVGDVADVTGAKAESDTARGFVVGSTSNGDEASPLPGNAYLVADGAITFTSAGREGSTATSAEVVSMSAGVFTAVAGTTLNIDTVNPNEAGEDQRTTLLRSETGVVTSIAGPEFDRDLTRGVVDLDDDRGPRALLDLPTDTIDAATTGIVRADDGFEQRITLALGSRGEENLLVEVEWADVANVREQSINNPTATEINRVYPTVLDATRVRDSYDQTAVPGSVAFADLVQTVGSDLEIDLDSRLDGTEPVVDYNGIREPTDGSEGSDFRIATIRNLFDIAFIPNNPAQNTLPTTVRVYNDPSINLFEAAASEEGPRDLNSASVALAPRIIAVQGGFFLPIEASPPQEIVPRDVIVSPNEALTSEQQTSSNVGRAVVASNAESLEFGRIDHEGNWINDIPGEAWPQVQEEVEGDFLREVRDQIDEGPYSEGTYRIQVVTPRGEQVLEEWVKDDLEGEGEVSADNGPLEDSTDQVPSDKDALLDPALPGRQPEMVPSPELIEPLSSLRATRPNSADGSTEVANATFAAMAAVGGWRRRFGDTGAFTLDADGVAFTRAKRRRRKRLD